MEALISMILEKVVDCTCGVAARRLAEYSKSVADLQEKLAELGRENGTLQGRVDQAKQDGHVIKDEVQNFLIEAARISEKTTNFLQVDCQAADVKCYVGSFPNLKSRRWLSKRAKKMIGELSHAVEALAGDGFHTIISRPALQSCIADRDGFEDFGTRELLLKNVMDFLSSDEVTKIGLYGMGGVGKTMLAKEVARQAAEKNMFNEVVFVTLSQTPNLTAIQQSVAEKIRLDFGGTQTKEERADRLQRRLKEEKRILVILDDIWDVLDLGEVGLTFERDKKGCKILMTSRNLNVTRSMGAEKNISVEVLDSNEATTLFATIVGKVTVEHSDLKNVAIDVVNECKGLPLALKTVASALKDKELYDWRDALLQLRSSAPNNIDGMLTRVYPTIKLSFEYLKSKEAKQLLLLCSLYQEDWNINVEDLTMLCVGWRLLQSVHSIGDARRRVWSLVGTLKDRCLLLDGDYDNHVKMHDVVRDVMMFIASEDRWDMHSVSKDDRLEDRLSSLEDAKAISLHECHNLKPLPTTKLECPRLELFFMSSNTTRTLDYSKTYISKDFLQECSNLKALSLFKADLVHSSIHILQNLVTLRLHCCKLVNIDHIGDLGSLIVLDLRDSDVRELPSKIGQLSRLQVLNLEDCRTLKFISANVISRLTELEELHIPFTFQNWEAGEVGAETRNANMAELMSLHRLTTLSVNIRYAKLLPKAFVFNQNLERYDIRIGESRAPKSQLSKALSIKNFTASSLGSLMMSSEHLRFTGNVGELQNNALSDMDRQGFPELKTIEIDDCDEIHYIIDDTEQKSSVQLSSSIFGRLQKMTLYRLKKLEKVSRGKLQANLFGQLSNVTVKDCGRLKNLFPVSVARRLHFISVQSCELMEEIFTSKVTLQSISQLEERTLSSGRRSFPDLQVLVLSDLTKLKKFCASINEQVVQLGEQESLFNESVALPKLQLLRLRNIGVQKIWTDDLISTSNNCMQISILENLYVQECHNLKCLLSIPDKLTTLVTLEVWDCRSLEVIFILNNYQGGDEEGTSSSSEKLSFPNLESIQLFDLPNLTKFDHKVAQSGEQEPLFNEMVFPKLEYLTLSGLNIESIFPYYDHVLLPTTSLVNLGKLESLRVTNCNKLKYLLSSAMAERLVNLTALEVSSCYEMESIVATKEDQQTVVSGDILFPKLESLNLMNLTALGSLCSGLHERGLFPDSISTEIIQNCPKLGFF